MPCKFFCNPPISLKCWRKTETEASTDKQTKLQQDENFGLVSLFDLLNKFELSITKNSVFVM